MEADPKLEKGLSGIDASKRRTLSKLALGAAFIAPVVASFSIKGLSVTEVSAQAPGGSCLISSAC